MRLAFILLLPLFALLAAYMALAAAVSGWDSGQRAFVLNTACFSAPFAGLAIASCLAAYRLWKTDLPFWDAIHMQVVAGFALISVTLAAVGVAGIAGVTEGNVGSRAMSLIFGGVTCVLAGLAASAAYRLWKAGEDKWSAVRTRVLAVLWLSAVSLIGFGIAVAVAAGRDNDAEASAFAFYLLVLPSVGAGVFAAAIAWVLSGKRMPSRREGRAVGALIVAAALFFGSLYAPAFGLVMLAPVLFGFGALTLVVFWRGLRRTPPNSSY